jgi:hypothetical protein
MDDLITFIKARLDEKAATVSRAGGVGVTAWISLYGEAGQLQYSTVAHADSPDGPWFANGEELPPSLYPPLVIQDSTRELRDVEAKRAIVTRFEAACRQADIADVNGDGPEQEAWEKIAGALDLDVRDLAAVWDDHPDYRPAWKV